MLIDNVQEWNWIRLLMEVKFVQSVALRQKSVEKWCQFMYNVTWLWGCREPPSTVIRCLLVWQDVAAVWLTSSLCLWTELSSYLQQGYKTNCQIWKPRLKFLLLFELSIPCHHSVNAVELSEHYKNFIYWLTTTPVWIQFVWSNSALCCVVLRQINAQHRC